MSRSQIDSMLAESEITGDDAFQLHAVLGPLVELVQDAPDPSTELRALFGEDAGAPFGAPFGVRDRAGSDGRRPRGRGTVAGAVVLALAGVGATGLSAAANSLPHALQHQVFQFSRQYLPFDFPEPAAPARGEGDAPDTGSAVESRPLQDADHGSRDVDPDSTRGLDHPRKTIRTAPPWVGPRSAERDGTAAYSGPSRHADEGRPGAAPPPAEAPATAGQPERGSADPHPQGREEKRSEEEPEQRPGHDRRGSGSEAGDRQQASGSTSADRGQEEQGSQAARPSTGDDGAGRDSGAGRDDDARRDDDADRDAAPRTPERPPAALPGLSLMAEPLGGPLGQADAPDG